MDRRSRGAVCNTESLTAMVESMEVGKPVTVVKESEAAAVPSCFRLPKATTEGTSSITATKSPSDPDEEEFQEFLIQQQIEKTNTTTATNTSTPSRKRKASDDSDSDSDSEPDVPRQLNHLAQPTSSTPTETKPKRTCTAKSGPKQHRRVIREEYLAAELMRSPPGNFKLYVVYSKEGKLGDMEKIDGTELMQKFGGRIPKVGDVDVDTPERPGKGRLVVVIGYGL
jgi:hypothetical protein